MNGARAASMRGGGRGVRAEPPPFRRDPIGQLAVRGGEADTESPSDTRLMLRNISVLHSLSVSRLLL